MKGWEGRMTTVVRMSIYHLLLSLIVHSMWQIPALAQQGNPAQRFPNNQFSGAQQATTHTVALQDLVETTGTLAPGQSQRYGFFTNPDSNFSVQVIPCQGAVDWQVMNKQRNVEHSWRPTYENPHLFMHSTGVSGSKFSNSDFLPQPYQGWNQPIPSSPLGHNFQNLAPGQHPGMGYPYHNHQFPADASHGVSGQLPLPGSTAFSAPHGWNNFGGADPFAQHNPDVGHNGVASVRNNPNEISGSSLRGPAPFDVSRLFGYVGPEKPDEFGLGKETASVGNPFNKLDIQGGEYSVLVKNPLDERVFYRILLIRNISNTPYPTLPDDKQIKVTKTRPTAIEVQWSPVSAQQESVQYCVEFNKVERSKITDRHSSTCEAQRKRRGAALKVRCSDQTTVLITNLLPRTAYIIDVYATNVNTRPPRQVAYKAVYATTLSGGIILPNNQIVSDYVLPSWTGQTFTFSSAATGTDMLSSVRAMVVPCRGTITWALFRDGWLVEYYEPEFLYDAYDNGLGGNQNIIMRSILDGFYAVRDMCLRPFATCGYDTDFQSGFPGDGGAGPGADHFAPPALNDGSPYPLFTMLPSLHGSTDNQPPCGRLRSLPRLGGRYAGVGQSQGRSVFEYHNDSTTAVYQLKVYNQNFVSPGRFDIFATNTPNEAPYPSMPLDPQVRVVSSGYRSFNLQWDRSPSSNVQYCVVVRPWENSRLGTPSSPCGIPGIESVEQLQNQAMCDKSNRRVVRHLISGIRYQIDVMVVNSQSTQALAYTGVTAFTTPNSSAISCTGGNAFAWLSGSANVRASLVCLLSCILLVAVYG